MKSTEKLEEPLRSLLDEYLCTLNRSDEGYYIDRIKEHLNDKNLALCVGAGLTSHFVGDWRKLLNMLLVMRCYSTLQNTSSEDLEHSGGKLSKNNVCVADLEEYIKDLRSPFLSANTSTLEIGEYLMYDSADDAPYIGAKEESSYREIFFAEQVRHVIFSSIKEKIGEDSLEDYFLANRVNEGVKSLASVVKLCLKKGITNIVTYNFDTILDRLLASEKVRREYGEDSEIMIHVHSFQKAEPILKFGTEGAPKINIYHVHGVVDKDIKEIEPIIFSENSYQSYQKTSLNWSNIRLADTMSRFHVLCVGFSGDDANFRMLRHFLSEREANPVMGDRGDKKELYLMRSFEWDIENLADPDKANKHPECAYACVKTYLDIVSAYFEIQLKTHIVWSDGFSEMAGQIDQLSL